MVLLMSMMAMMTVTVTVLLLVCSSHTIVAWLSGHPVGPRSIASSAVATVLVASSAWVGIPIPVDNSIAIASGAASSKLNSGQSKIVWVGQLGHPAGSGVHGVGIHAWVPAGVHTWVHSIRIHAWVIGISIGASSSVHSGVPAGVHTGIHGISVHTWVVSVGVHAWWEVGVGVHAWIPVPLISGIGVHARVPARIGRVGGVAPASVGVGGVGVVASLIGIPSHDYLSLILMDMGIF